MEHFLLYSDVYIFVLYANVYEKEKALISLDLFYLQLQRLSFWVAVLCLTQKPG